MPSKLAREVEFYDFTSEDFTAPDCPLAYSIPETREEIERLLKKEDPSKMTMMRLERADRTIIDFICNLPDDYDEDDPSQPLEKWWWHLRTIKEGKFPVKFLPSKKSL